jgi:hypothetical protein
MEAVVDRANPIMDHMAMAESVRDLALGLLRSNSLVAREAAAIFYQTNTFGFRGDHNWDAVIAWLVGIGDVNRAFLTLLEIPVRSPTHVQQNADGTRVALRMADLSEEVYQLSSRFSRAADENMEGIVENVNPAIEDMFKLLGSEGSKLTLYLLLPFGFFPGCLLEEDGREAGAFYSGMDVPNLVETVRVIHTSGKEGSPRIEAIWKGEASTPVFVRLKPQIEKRYWVILDEEEGVRHRRGYGVPDWDEPTIKFSLMRRALTGDLVAEAPYPMPY